MQRHGQERRIVVHALSHNGGTEQDLESVLFVEERGAFVCELLASADEGVGDEDVAFRRD